MPTNQSFLMNSLAVGGLIATAALILARRHGCFGTPISRRHRRMRDPSEEELYYGSVGRWVDDSICATMPPAVKLGIQVEHVNADGLGLSLRMPLAGNTNVHGTAFAGSLYSLAALCSWYTLVCFLRSQLDDHSTIEKFTVVIKSAEIAYKRPAVTEIIVARSTLPTSKADIDMFLSMLKQEGKATIGIKGMILGQDENKPAADYVAILCAYQPRFEKTF